MNPQRLPHSELKSIDSPNNPTPAPFFLASMPPSSNASTSSMQWLYQQLYLQAQQGQQPTPARDFFAVMN
jgi:hypothetical protein